MKSLPDLVRHGKTLAEVHSPGLLTAIGVTGVVTTAVLASQASFKAAEILRREQIRRDNQYEYLRESHGRNAVATNAVRAAQAELTITPRDKFQLLWKLYVPAVASAVTACSAMVVATRIGSRRTAAMTAATVLTERAFNEYREKVTETIGKNKEQKIRSEIAQDRVSRTDGALFVAGDGKVPCYDAYTGRPFPSTMEDMKKAQNDTNYMMLHQGYASLNDFYEKLGVDRVKMGDDMGWNSDIPIELTFTAAIHQHEGKEQAVMVMDFRDAPSPGYWRGH